MTGRYSIVPARPEHDEKVAALLSDRLGGSLVLWRERMTHWDRNPARTHETLRGWVALAPGGSVAGFLGAAPFRYVTDAGETLLAYAAHTHVARDGSRRAGLGRRLVAAIWTADCAFTLGTRSNAGGRAASRRGGAEFLDQDWTSRARLVAADWGALVGRVGRVPAVLRRPAAAAARIAGAALASFERPVRGLTIAPTDSFDLADDAALAALVARPARIRPVRDARLLNWMYFGTPHLRRSRLVLTARRDGALVGYAGFRKVAGSLVLTEARTLPGDEGALHPLMRAARSAARRERLSHIVVHPYSEALEAVLPRFAAFSASRRFPFLIIRNDPAIVAGDIELGPWDGDAVFNDDAPATESLS